MKAKFIIAAWILALAMLMTIADNLILSVVLASNFFLASYRLLRNRIAVYREMINFENKIDNFLNN